MAGNDEANQRTTGSTTRRGSVLRTAGLTSTRASTPVPSAAGCSCASRSASAAPIESPPTVTTRHRARSSLNAASTSVYQSAQVVRFISCQVVPCPGSRGSRTV
jgi:hypothetical protein